MKEYFSLDSTAFTVATIVILISGHSFLLLVWSVLTILFLLFKAGFSMKNTSGGETNWIVYFMALVFAWAFFAFVGISLILFGVWFTVIVKKYLNK